MKTFWSSTAVKAACAFVLVAAVAGGAYFVRASRADAAGSALPDAAAAARMRDAADVAEADGDWVRQQQAQASRAAAAQSAADKAAKLTAGNQVVAAGDQVVAAAAGKVDAAALVGALDALRAALNSGVYSAIDQTAAVVGTEQQRVNDAIVAFDAEQARLAAEQAAAQAAGTKTSTGKTGTSSSKPSGTTSSGAGSTGGAGSPAGSSGGGQTITGPVTVTVTSCADSGDGNFTVKFSAAGLNGSGSFPALAISEGAIDGWQMNGQWVDFTNPGAFAAACGM